MAVTKSNILFSRQKYHGICVEELFSDIIIVLVIINL